MASLMSGSDRVKTGDPGWFELLEEPTVGLIHGTRVVRGQLRAPWTPDHPEVKRALERWDGRVYLHPREAAGGTTRTEAAPARSEAATRADVVLLQDVQPDRPRWWLHVLLFALTLFTTHMAGALIAGLDPLGTGIVQMGPLPLPYPTTVEWGVLARGAPFALPFMGILLAHELGHYLTARRYGIRVTPPFFIPFPAYGSLIGTLGAFIRIKGPMVRRSILLDVGAAGPLVSFVLSLPVYWVGLGRSTVAGGSADSLTPFVAPFAGEAIWIGSGAVTHLLAWLRFPDALGAAPIVLHPTAFAGWLGLFFTALNLLPLGQLDGGHVLYSLSRDAQRGVARLFLLSLLPLGLLWGGWWLWAVVVIVLHRGRLTHPPLMQEQRPLQGGRRLVVWACVAIFLATLAPLPVRL